MSYVLNVKALVGTFNQEKTLVGAFSVIVQLHRLIVYSTGINIMCVCSGWVGLHLLLSLLSAALYRSLECEWGPGLPCYRSLHYH